MIKVRAFAKINLGLSVLGPRTDGYHEIRTILQAIDLADLITFEKAPSLSLRVLGRYRAPRDETNLVMKAARCLAERYPGRGARITLSKSIPAGAGLGGGSSNAAATLMALDRLWGLDADPGLLYSVARGLGTDVPFFLFGGACLAVGRGDEVLPLPDFAPWHVVVVWPGVSLSTREVYAGLSGSLTTNPILSSMKGFVPDPGGRTAWDPGASPDEKEEGEDESAPPEVTNDLEEIAFQKLPVLKQLKERLIDSGAAAAAMTGSGSAVYGLYRLRKGIEKVAASLATDTTAAFTCRTLTREAYRLNLFERSRT
jgi:4-diphosphocytidyl-2-C-methyl-D-erythritol kinase